MKCLSLFLLLITPREDEIFKNVFNLFSGRRISFHEEMFLEEKMSFMRGEQSVADVFHYILTFFLSNAINVHPALGELILIADGYAK